MLNHFFLWSREVGASPKSTLGHFCRSVDPSYHTIGDVTEHDSLLPRVKSRAHTHCTLGNARLSTID